MAQHTGTPQAHRTYHTTYSAACSKYGDGQCDGYVPEEDGEEFSGDECGCDCHNENTDCPMDSRASVAKWHANEHHLFG